MMLEDPQTSQTRPFAPAGSRGGPAYSPTYTTPLQPAEQHRWSRYHKTSSKFVVYLFTFFVISCAALLAFALVVRPRSPDFRMTEVRVKSLTYSANNGNSTAALNVTLVAVLEVSNPNFGRFDHENSTVRVVYGGSIIVGEGAVLLGRAGGKGTEKMEAVIDVGAQGSAANNGVFGNLTRDVGSGLVKLNSYGRVSGRVYYLMGSDKLKKRKTADMNCEMKLNLTSRLVQDLACH